MPVILTPTTAGGSQPGGAMWGFTLGAVVAQARRWLVDQDDAYYRWPQALLMRYANRALQAWLDRHPEYKLQPDGTVLAGATYSETALLNLPAVALDGLAHSVCAMALSDDSEDGNAAMAGLHAQRGA